MTTDGHHRLTLANRISIFRILGVPVFVLFLTYYILSLKHSTPNDCHRWSALAIFILLALSDALDGYFARSRNEVTLLGKILDPLADKALIAAALIVMTRPSLEAITPQFPVMFTVLVLSREVFLIAGAFVIHHYTGAVDVHTRWSGKAATALLMCAIAYALLKGPVTPFLVLIGITALLIIISWAQYLIDGMHQVERSS